MTRIDYNDIDKICEHYGISKYKINSDDGSIDVDGDVILTNLFLEQLPLNFNKVNGKFRCNFNKLTSLEGSPAEVFGNFVCSDNNLASLKGGPTKVTGYYDCNENALTSLEYAPEEVGQDFFCAYNKNLTSLKFLPKKLKSLYALNNSGLKNPYEFRYIFFSQIQQVGIDDDDIKEIINRYYGKPEYYHVAIDELLELADYRGFKN